MANKDIFAPPSKEELEMFAPPQEAEMADSQEISPLKAAGMGAVNQFGLAPVVGGAAQAGADVAGPEFELRDFLDRYRARRDELKGKFKQAEEQQPLSYLGGNIAAGMALPIPGASIKGAAGLGKFVKQGALLGGAAGLSSSEADLTRPNAENLAAAAQDVATGATLGAGGGVLGKLLQKASMAAPAAKEASQDAALKALGLSEDLARKEYGLKKGIKSLEEGYRKGVGETLIDDNIMTLFGGADAVRQNVRPLLEKQARVVSSIRDQANNAIREKGLDFKPFDDEVQRLENYFAKKLEGVSGGDQRLAKIKRVLEEQKGKYNFVKDDIKRLNDLKVNLEKDLTDRAFSRSTQDLPEMQEVDLAMSRMLKSRIEDMTEQAQPGLGAQLREQNAKLSNYLDIATAATDKAVKDITNKSAEVGDYVALGFGVPAYLAKKGFEFQAGQSSTETLRRAQALGLAGAASALEKPGVQKTLSGMSSGISAATRAPSDMTGLKADKPRDSFSSNDLAAKAQELSQYPDKYAQELGQILNNLAGRSDRERNAMMFALQEQPQYRKYLRSE